MSAHTRMDAGSVHKIRVILCEGDPGAWACFTASSVSEIVSQFQDAWEIFTPVWVTFAARPLDFRSDCRPSAPQTMNFPPQDSEAHFSLSVRTRRILRLLWPYVIVFGWLWFWRAGGFSGGDSEQWVREIDGGEWFQETQPGVFLIVQSVFRAIELLFGGTARMAFGIVSCLAGVVAVAVIVRLFEDQEGHRLRSLLVLTAGFATIFYGHLETYASPASALLLHLLCVKRCREDRWPVFSIPLSYLLMVGLHLVALFVMPVVLTITFLEARRRRLKAAQWTVLLLILAGAFVLWFLIRFLGTGRSRDSVSYLMYVFRGLAHEPIVMLGKLDLGLKLKFAFWNGGLISILLIQIWQRRKEPLIRYWALYLVCFLGFTFLWGTSRGVTDFDLHSFPWIVLTVLAARAYRPVYWSRVAVLVIFTVNAGLWLDRTVRFADLPHRGSATILVEPGLLKNGAYVLIDNSLRLHSINRFVPMGPHQFTRFAPGSVQRAEFQLDRGKLYELGVHDAGNLILTESD